MIHPSAIVSAKAKIGNNVQIGEFSIIGDNVTIQDDVILKSHVVIEGHTEIGAGSIIHPFSAIGTIPQDLKYTGEDGKVIIGKKNVIREHVTINIGTKGGGMLTRIGDDNLLMVGVHIGHDCIIGNKVILVNNATLAGHVIVDDMAVLGGLSAVHQFCHIGKMAMIGGMSGVEHDIIPYGLVTGNRAVLKGLNLVGLSRSNIEKSKVNSMRAAFKTIFHSDLSIKEAITEVAKEYPDHENIMEIINFLKRESKRRFVMPEK